MEGVTSFSKVVSEMELKNLETSLKELNLNPLDSLFNSMDFEEFEPVLYRLAYNPESGNSNFFIYTYMLRLLGGKESDWRIHLSISRLMGVILNHIDGCELIGLYHAKEADKLKPMDANILETILYYNHIPEKILTDEEALIYSKKLLMVKPNSDIAKGES